jgi:hypothetical protein
MTVKRKVFQEKPEKEKLVEIPTKKIKKGFKVDTLQDAIIDGVFTGHVGSELIVERFRNGKNSLIVCTVKTIDPDGLIHTWDDTVNQWFDFSTKEPPKIVKFSTSKE